MASTAKAYPTDPLAAAATEPSVRLSEASPAFAQTSVDGAERVVEVPVRSYSAYAPGVIVARKFQLVRVLGEGGMGSVWVAKNLALDVHVALKLIRAELARCVPGLEERLLQEARAAASIEHPAVIQIFDFGLTELEDPFIAMELLHGESLAGTIKRRGKVSPVRAVQTLLPIADALLSAHERGVVHRDLKPDNIFLSRGSGGGLEPKVLDFGIAKFDRKLTPSLTGAGTVLGSPAYMSPEQARGESDVDGRTDVWALCVVLYEAITGRLPFAGENYNALMYAILEGQPKTFNDLAINEPLLWSVIARGLEKERDRRCPDMFELGRALATWLLARGIQEDVCHALLKSKWLERPQRRAAARQPSFFPSEPPAMDAEPGTLRSEGESPPLGDELSSGVLLRSAGEPGPSQRSGPPLATTVRTPRFVPGAVRRVVQGARSRWVWLTVAGALLSFSAAVGLQALSGSRDDDELQSMPRRALSNASRNPLSAVAPVVPMPRPLPSSSASTAADQQLRRRNADGRPATPRPLRLADPKAPRGELKGALR